ncbi:autotransporter-associated beta strand repeat-containing protein [Luteibacter sp. Lutesp34]|uniref:autotransporter-associated beta strand repeat-containing protein n=1 Tax=Luteibacter sp. Lutesp34 TaxID=3243030 RepID=UPI0039B58021
MNRIFRIVWNRAISQLVVTSELGRRTSGGSVAKHTPRTARTTVLSLAALAVALSFATPAFADAGYLSMPGGALLDINNGTAPNSASNVANQFQNYTVTFTPTQTGNNYILFAFRQDPAYWTFGNVGLYAAGDTTTNLFTNPLFTQGGQVPDKDVQAPAGWGVVYQAGTTPEAAGTWNAPGSGDQTTTNVNTATAGSWYDGAVGSFDGIYQGVSLVAGTVYTISFTALSNDTANTAGSADGGVEMGVYAGQCVSLLGPVANCVPDNPDFVQLATPGDAANAGGPSVVTIDPANPTTTTGLGTTDGAFDGGTLTVDQNNVHMDQDLTVSDDGGTIDQNDRDSTFTGVISDATPGIPGDLNIVNSTGGGSVTLTGENTYTGGTTIGNGATLVLAGDGSIATSSGVTNNGTLDIGQANGNENIASLGGNGTVTLGANDLNITNGHDTYTGTIGGTGGVNVTGGTQGFTGTNTYTGGTTVADATVSIDNGSALGTGTVTLANGTLDTTESMVLANGIDVQGTGTVDTVTGTTLTHTGAVTGEGDFVKDGAGTLEENGNLSQDGATVVNGGTLVLNGNNTYTGGTIVENGSVLQVSSDANLGAASGDITLVGGSTLAATDTMSTGRDVTLVNGGRTYNEVGDTLTLGGTVSGNGGLVHQGQGTLVLDGANTYTGGTTVGLNGTLQIADDANLGDATGSLTLDGGTVHSTGDVDSSRDILVSPADGYFNTDAQTTFATSGDVSGAGSINKVGEGTLRIDGDANQSGGFNVAQGTLVLNGNNGYNGTTLVSQFGTVQINGAAALGSELGGPVVLNQGTLATTGNVDTGKQIVIFGNGTLDIGAGTTTTATGMIAGTGTLVKSGDGTLVLSNAQNVLSGDTQIDEGTLEIANDANLGNGANVIFNGGSLHTTGDVDSSRNLVLNTEGAIDTDAGTTMSTGGNVSGVGGLVKNGAGVLEIDGVASHMGGTTVNGGTLVLNGNNTYTGGTVVNAGGTLAVSSDANLGDASGNLALNGGTLHATGTVVTTRDVSLDDGGTLAIDNGSAVRIDGTVSGNGGLVQSGGQLVLGRTNTYTGGTTVENGTLTIYQDAALGTGDLSLDHGTLYAAGSMTSSRDIDVIGTGTVTVGGGDVYTHTGDVTGTGDFVAYGHGRVEQTGSLTQDGATISDGGVLVLSSTGNTYGGGTQVLNGGVVQVSSDANLGAATGDITLGNGGTLYASSTMSTARDVHLANGGKVSNDAGENLTLGGTVSGNGGLMQSGLGTLVLSGTNTYTGGTYVGPNSVVSVSRDSNLGDASGNVFLDGGELLTTGNVNSARDIVTSAYGGMVATGANTTFVTSGDVSGNGTFYTAGQGTVRIDGNVNQAGGVHVMGGTLVLNGNNGYTGPTTIDLGSTLQVSSDDNLGAGGNVVFQGGTLHTTATINSDRNVVLNGDAHFDVDAGTTMATGGTASGAGALVKNGDGRLVIGGVASHTGGTIVNDGILVLTANNTYTGGNTINGGILQVQKDANLGDASNGIDFAGGSLRTTGSFTTARDLSLNGSGAIDTQVGTTLTATGAVSGAAGLVKNGAGTLDISGVASHLGGTTVNAGTLILGGNNTYKGGTTINGGTLQVSSDANLGDASGNIAINGGNLTVTQTMSTDRDILIGSHGAQITTLDGVTLNQHGDMSGNGGLVKLGGGTLVVYGNNTFTGGTLIQGGVIRINSGSSLGTGQILLQGGTLQSDASLGTGQEVVISGDSGVNVAAGTTTVLSGNLVAGAGNGCFVKSGKGYLSLTGQSSLASGTCVEDGVLSANGLLASSFVQVDQGAMLRGIGVISGPVNVDGRLAAGNSPGTLTVTGTVTMQAGSSLQVDIDGLGTGNGAGNYSRVLVVGEGNRFVADGTLVPTLRGITGNASNTYTPALGSTYRIVTADGGVEGRFDGIQQPTEGLPANARFLAFYGANDGHSIDLRVAPVSYATLLGAGAKRNGLAAAGSLDGAVQAMDAGTATATQNELLYAVSSLGADRVASMVGSLSGEVHADQAAAARSAGLGMQRDVSDHLATDRSPDMAHNVWANVTRDGNRSIADNQGRGFETGTDRTTGGVDLYAEGGTVLGVAATHHDTNVISHGGSGSIRGTSGMVYAQQALGSFVLDGVAAYGNTDWTTRRPDPLGGSQLETRTSGKDTMASATLRMPMQTAAGSRIEPYVSVVWQKVERDAVNERGSVAALSLDELSEKGTRVLAGVTMGSKAADPLASTLTWHAGVAVGADTGDLLDPTVHNTLAGQRFDTAAPGVGRGFVQVNANGTMRLGKSTYLYGGLTAEEGRRRSAYGVTAGVRVAF